jgi:hypothetical protein
VVADEVADEVEALGGEAISVTQKARQRRKRMPPLRRLQVLRQVRSENVRSSLMVAQTSVRGVWASQLFRPRRRRRQTHHNVVGALLVYLYALHYATLKRHVSVNWCSCTVACYNSVCYLSKA